MVRAGRLSLAAHLLLGVMLSALTVAQAIGFGLWSVTSIHLPLVVVLSGLLLNIRGLILWASATMASLLVLAGLHWTDLTPIEGNSSDMIAAQTVEMAMSLCIVGVAMIAVQRRAHQALTVEIQDRRRAELAALTAARAREQFLAIMSHEVRTPLHGILGASALLDTITSSGELLRILIDDILDYSRMSSDSIELERVPVHLSAVLDQATRILRLSAQQKGLAMEVRCSPLLPDWIFSDEVRIKQIVLNLTGNAIKFTDSGFIRITATPDDPGFWRLQLVDDGIGIPESAMEGLFDPFTQADVSTSRQYGGAGLGLAIVNRIVALMGGSISLTSQLGEGTTATIRLPLIPADPPADTVSVPLAPTSGLRILLVDDHPLNRMVAARILEQAGHRVREAVDGFEALAAAEQGGLGCDPDGLSDAGDGRTPGHPQHSRAP
ncbi:MAG: signal transduction histidine kinase [Myxococcota bacterium]